MARLFKKGKNSDDLQKDLNNKIYKDIKMPI